MGSESNSHAKKPYPLTHSFTGMVYKKECESTLLKDIRVNLVVGVILLKPMV